MNDLVRSILYADEVVTIASFGRNAGAGGVFMGLACDYAVAKEGVVLNPHYKTLGLSGSEYHSYTLPKRVGEEISERLLYECLPLSVEKAKAIHMIDRVYGHKIIMKTCMTSPKMLIVMCLYGKSRNTWKKTEKRSKH
jgi:putative two-component system hydrogenase maturation factor HypX/HoxX